MATETFTHRDARLHSAAKAPARRLLTAATAPTAITGTRIAATSIAMLMHIASTATGNLDRESAPGNASTQVRVVRLRPCPGDEPRRDGTSKRAGKEATDPGVAVLRQGVHDIDHRPRHTGNYCNEYQLKKQGGDYDLALHCLLRRSEISGRQRWRHRHHCHAQHDRRKHGPTNLHRIGLVASLHPANRHWRPSRLLRQPLPVVWRHALEPGFGLFFSR